MLTAIAQDRADRNGHVRLGRIVQAEVRRNADGARSQVADRGPPVLRWLDRQLLDACEREFPICEKPFTEIAHRLNRRTDEVIRHFRELERCGVIDRVGPAPVPEPVGASTLVAMAVPKARLGPITETVTGYRGVNDVRERRHEFNLWFALAAPNAGELFDTVADIRQRTGVEVLDLRPERHYCGDAGSAPWHRAASVCCGLTTEVHPLDASDRRLLAALREGLSFTARPYSGVANRVDISEAQVIERLKRLRKQGVIERMGVVLRHHPSGADANALVIFDVACHQVDRVGERLAQVEWIDQCYRCIRRGPIWPYNLYCTPYDDRDLASLLSWVDEEIFGIVRCPRRAILLGRAVRVRRNGQPAIGVPVCGIGRGCGALLRDDLAPHPRGRSGR